MDGGGSTAHKRKVHFRYAKMIQDLLTCNDTKFGGKRRSQLVTVLQYGIAPLLPILHAVGHERLIRWMDRVARKYDYDSSEYVGVLEGRALEKEAMRKQDMEPAVLVDFWGEKFYAMANYDQYLTNLYGDYMTPPQNPESRHLIDIYWKDGVSH